MEAIDPGEIFDEDETTQGDFEIAFAALITTMVLAVPTDTRGYHLLKILLMLLTAVILLRRMAVSNTYASSEPVLRWTTPIILAITNVAFIYLTLEGATFLGAVLSLSVSPILIASIFVPIFVLVVFVFHELVLHDANIYLGLLCHNGAAKTSDVPMLGISDWGVDWFLNHGSGLLQASRAETIPPELGWIEHRAERTPSPNWLPIAVFGIIGYGAVWAVISWVFGSGVLTLLFLLLVFALIYPIQFWLSRFGLAPFTTQRSGWINPLVVLLGLFIAHSTILPMYL